MSRDIHVYLEHFNDKENKWEAVQMFTKSHFDHYKKEGLREVAFIEGGWGDWATIITDGDWSGYPDLHGIKPIYESSLSDEVKEYYKKLFDEEGKLHVGYFGLKTINMADVVNYITKYPEVNDYESEDENAKIKNPLSFLIERVNVFADLTDIWFDSYSEFRLVYWGDC